MILIWHFWHMVVIGSSLLLMDSLLKSLAAQTAELHSATMYHWTLHSDRNEEGNTLHA